MSSRVAEAMHALPYLYQRCYRMPRCASSGHRGRASELLVRVCGFFPVLDNAEMTVAGPYRARCATFGTVIGIRAPAAHSEPWPASSTRRMKRAAYGVYGGSLQYDG